MSGITPEIAIVIFILLTALVLFISELIRMDLVALLVLVSLFITGSITSEEALNGFSNPAVITVWGMFILSAALTETGVANIIGKQVLKLAGKTESRMIIVIMLTSGILSAFMNNIGVAALMLPVVMDISRKTKVSPSKLLMPLAYGCLLGGLTTLIGTPPNLVASEILEQRGYEGFKLFDFAGVGGVSLVVGIIFVAFFGKKLLPNTNLLESANSEGIDLKKQYGLSERSYTMHLGNDSFLAGKKIIDTRLGSAASLTIFAIIRSNKTLLAPEPDFILEDNDTILVQGRLDHFEELKAWRELVIDESANVRKHLLNEPNHLFEIQVTGKSEIINKTLAQLDFKAHFNLNVLAIKREELFIKNIYSDSLIKENDFILLYGSKKDFDNIKENKNFVASSVSKKLVEKYELDQRVFSVSIPENSVLINKNISESRFSDAFSLRILEIVRGKKNIFLPDSQEILNANDILIVQGRKEEIEVLKGLQSLEIEADNPEKLLEFESKDVGLIEATLSPRSDLVDKTLREIRFREKYGVQVLALWRNARAYRSHLRDMKLGFGDAILLQGERRKLNLIQNDPDLLVLTESEKKTDTNKALLATLIMLLILIPVMAGKMPIAIAAILGATLMVITKCLTMESAYRSIDWKSVFLIAGMLPLGTAMQKSGAANLIAEGVGSLASPYGPWGLMIGLYVLTSIATCIIPTAALVVLMGPIAIKTSLAMGINPQSAMMAVAIAASASFTSPISHATNVLVMGPGGYKFKDYLKIGIPLTLVIMCFALPAIAFFWPLKP